MAMVGGFGLGAVGKFIKVVIGQAIREKGKNTKDKSFLQTNFRSSTTFTVAEISVTWGSYNGGVSSSLSA